MSRKRENGGTFVRHPQKGSLAMDMKRGRLSQIEGLGFIAERLNEVLSEKLPEGRELGRQLVRLSREKSGRDYTWKDDPLSCWRMMEGIIEAMTDQPSREKPLPSPRKLLTQKSWDSYNRVLLPTFSISAFNDFAEENPVPLKVVRRESRRETEIHAGHHPTNEIQEALWFVWRFFFHDRGWERLKRCPQCMRWFVDDTRNKQKLRCSSQCTWQWWSRDKRKEAGHRVPKGKKRKR